MPSWTNSRRCQTHRSRDKGVHGKGHASSDEKDGTLAVVLAAGRGTRLGPLTDLRSKAMMPIVGMPIIERVLEMLATGGARRFIVVAHPGDGELPRHLDRSTWREQTRLVYQHKRLGMAHALECAAPLIREERGSNFLLASCDSLYPPAHVARLLSRHREEAPDATLTLMWASRREAMSSAVVIQREGFVTDIIEKPSRQQISEAADTSQVLTAPSLYALSDRILDHLPEVAPSERGEYEFPQALRLLIAAGGRVAGEYVADRFTLTRPRDLLAINRHFLSADPRTAVVEAPLPPHTILDPPVRIEVGVHLGPHVRIGPEVYLESGCVVRQGVQISRAVILRGGSTDASIVIDEAVVGSNG